MALGDGIRRNIAEVSAAERLRLKNAIVALQQQLYAGSRTDSPPGGVSKWFKQDEIHAHSHVHGCPAFLPWHRELVNRFEALIREVDPQLSLHYWDWTQDPSNAPDGQGGFVNLFTTDFMGSAQGDVGDPWRSAGFYDPNANPFRSDNEFDPANNPADPPRAITRAVQPGAPMTPQDEQGAVGQPDFPSFDGAIEPLHGAGHGHIGGTLGDPHTSFRDPIVFLLHSNVDRLFALWQLQVPSTRLDPTQVYGSWSSTQGSGDVATGEPNWGILSPLEPWAGPAAQTGATGIIANVQATRPWAAPENEQLLPENRKDSRHPSVVRPPCYDTNPTVITVVNPGNAIHFNDVPSGETTLRAAHFQIVSCQPLTFRVTAGPGAPYTVFTAGGQTTVTPNDTDIWGDARIWFSFTGQAANTSAPASSVTIHCDQTNQDFVFSLSGNSITRPTVAAMLVLDQSGSMNDPAGTTGVTRVQALREAAGLFVDVIEDGNAIGLVRFDTTAYPVNDPTYPGYPVTAIGAGGMFDPGRAGARTAVAAHATNVNGSTSIGAGVVLGRSTLAPVTGYQDKALVVFTDGLENTAPMIADVMSNIDQRTFAIGLGNASQVSTAALTALTNGTGGYLLLTGLLSTSIDDYFLLSKYFLQILAGVTNTAIVLDPSGFLPAGVKVRIPFTVAETDIDSTALLLTDLPAVDYALETPGGDLISPTNATAVGSSYNNNGTTSYYRHTLPLALPNAAAGTWHSLLELNPALFKRYCGQQDRPPENNPCARGGIRYSFSALARSNLNLRARLNQAGLVPGSTLTITATLDEYGVPVDHRATLTTHITDPNGTSTELAMAEIQPGRFQASTIATVDGVYPIRVQAVGTTFTGTPFTREQTLTAAVFHGGDQPLPTTPPKSDGELCCLLRSLIAQPAIREQLDKHGLDPKGLLSAIEHCCHDRG